MHRIVHLDLKGAPWKISYLEKVLLLFKKWGATGILLEWEDTFPYSGVLVDIGSQHGMRGSGGDGLYSIEEIRYILQLIKDIGMEAIQLIQTIGHMEFVLKHQAFRSLREMARSPAVLCPSNPESLVLVRTMITQVLELQPDASYLHIGADEVWHIGVCPECQIRAAASQHKTAVLFLEHIRELVRYIKLMRPNLKVLIWDDMLRGITVDVLKEYNLGELVEPVLWHYNPKECFQVDPNLWSTYGQVFSRVWTGSAFKGANGSCQILSPVSRYVSNHEAWVEEMNKYKNTINFGGVILTGWSRYDHYATLCELLPVSLPSLASCLKILTKNETNAHDNQVSETLPAQEWPGHTLVCCIHMFVMLRERCYAFINGDQVATWLNPWQLANNYTNPIQIEGVAVAAQHLINELSTSQETLYTNILELTGERSSEEWVQSLVAPLSRKVTELRDLGIKRASVDAAVHPTP